MPETKPQKFPSSPPGQGRRWLFGIGVLALALTALLWVQEMNLEERRSRDLSQRQAAMIAGEIEEQIHRYALLLHSAAGIRMHSETLERREWRRFVEALDIDANFPGVSGIGLVKRVVASERESFLRKAREDWPEFQIFPERNLSEHYINYFLEPERVYRAVGFDIASREDRKEAADRARDSGKMAITGKTTLITPGASGSGLLMYLPIYKTAIVPESVELRQQNLWGWLTVAVSLPQMMRSIHERSGGTADIAIYDGEVKRPESLMFGVSVPDHFKSGDHAGIDIRRIIGGRVWTIDFSWHPEFVVRSGRAFVILTAGVAATILMALTAWVLLSARARAEARANQRSKELERERDFANALLTSSPAAILTLDSDGVITRSNAAGSLMSGLAQADMAGRSFIEIFVPESDRDTFAWSLSTLKVGSGPMVLEMAQARAGERHVINWTVSAVREANQPVRYFVAAGIDVTQHRQAEEALRAERALFVSGPVVVFRWKAEAGWPVEYVSPNVSQFGCRPGVLLSGELPFMNLIHPDDLGRVASDVSRLTAQGVVGFEQKYRLIRPSDGEVRWVDDRTIIERDGQGRPSFYLGYLIDVTEREKLVEAGRSSEARIARVLEMSSEGYWELDADGRTVATNPALRAMFEIDEASILGKTPHDFVAPGWNERMDAVLGESKAVANRRFEMAYRSGSGKIVHTRVNATSLFDAGGAMIGSYGLLTDVTNEKAAEEALRSEQGRLRLIVDSVPLALVISRIDEAVVVNANQAAQQLFGFGDEDMSGHRAADLYAGGEDRRRFIDTLRREGVVTDFEAHMKRRDGGTFWAMLSARLVTFEGADCALIGCMDISARKLAEERLGAMADELARSNAELEQFAYVASHDLQEPLRMIASYVQLLERRYGDKLGEDAREYIDYAVDGAKRMQNLITDLLEFSRLARKGSPFAPVSLEKLAGEAAANLAVTIRETGAKLSIVTLPEVMGDQVQLVRLFQNLIGNALKYRKPDQAPEISINAKRIAHAWEIHVADNGIGINKAYFERIFVIFQRLHTRADYPGTGIGLALCKKIVERHGGQIRVVSTEGEGADFIFTIPTLS
ncbi:MAG: PAS domain S-box protein [Rhodospirillales bacterium]|nr:PAS domain S-box protein [Rhodospirillales bacterium]